MLAISSNTPAHAQNTVLEVIALKHRTAEQLIPVLAPLVRKPGTLSGLQHQLVVRATPANLADIKQALATLDAAPRRLSITVRQDLALNRDGAGAITGSTSLGGAAVEIPDGGRQAAAAGQERAEAVVRGRIDSTRGLDSNRSTQTLQVLEGNSASIRIGQQVPLPQRRLVRTVVNGQLFERVIDAVEYREVVTGFDALPRLAGDRVTLEISSQRDTLSTQESGLPGSINLQRAVTTVSGRLGEWMEIGSLTPAVSDEHAVVLGSTRETSADNRRILIKVELIR